MPICIEFDKIALIASPTTSNTKVLPLELYNWYHLFTIGVIFNLFKQVTCPTIASPIGYLFASNVTKMYEFLTIITPLEISFTGL